MSRVDQAFENLKYTGNELKKRGYKPLYIGLYGSDNYELSTEKSDYDFKAIVAPTIDNFIKNKQISTTIELPFGLCDIKNPQNIFNCWKKQNINFIEILFTDYYLCSCKWFMELRNIREEIAKWNAQRAVNCIMGMAMEKRHALFHSYPSNQSKIQEYGYDGKQLHHLIRLEYFIDRYWEVVNNRMSYKEALILPYEDRENLISIKNYRKIYSLLAAEKYADNTIEYIEIFKKKHIWPQEDIETTNKMDDILKNIIKESLKEELLLS